MRRDIIQKHATYQVFDEYKFLAYPFKYLNIEI